MSTEEEKKEDAPATPDAPAEDAPKEDAHASGDSAPKEEAPGEDAAAAPTPGEEGAPAADGE